MIDLLAALAMSATFQMPTVDDREMIAASQSIVREHGGQVWHGMSQAPLPILLIDQKQETLFCGAPAEGFSPAGFDPVTNCSLQSRARVLPTDLSAATYLGDQQVIHMGLATTLEMTKAEWMTAFLHEAFHQYQRMIPSYVEAVEQVRNEFGKDSSQWMLNYDFPYADPDIKAAFARMNAAGLRFLESSEGAKQAAIADYITARNEAMAVAGSRDWLYFEFQAGQEGVARWTEIRLGELVSATHPDIAEIAKDRRAGLATSLRAIDRNGLDMWKRSAFYIYGAVEAQMLDELKTDWRRRYLEQPFSLGQMLAHLEKQP